MLSDDYVHKEVVLAIHKLAAETLGESAEAHFSFYTLKPILEDEIRRYDQRVVEILEQMVKGGLLEKSGEIFQSYVTTDKFRREYEKLVGDQISF